MKITDFFKDDQGRWDDKRLHVLVSEFNRIMNMDDYMEALEAATVNPSSFNTRLWERRYNNFPKVYLYGPVIVAMAQDLMRYNISAGLKKKLTKIFQAFNRKRLVVRNPSAITVIDAIQNLTQMVLDSVEVLKQSVREARRSEESEEETLAVVPEEVSGFRIVDMADTPPKKMAVLVPLIREAVQRLKSVGLQRVVYGDIHLTLTLLPAKVLAFYQIKKDEFYVRANLRNDSTTLATILHELGHRYEHKFQPNARLNLERLYWRVSSQDARETSSLGELPYPEVGAELKHKRKTFVVQPRRLDGSWRGKVILKQVGGVKDGEIFSTPIKTYHDLQGTVPSSAKEGGFVSNYARKSASENYAEMFSQYCLGELDDTNRELFELCLKGELA